MPPALNDPLLRCTEEVEDALAEQKPLVALESTLLSHGLPEQVGARVAKQLEDAVRAEGAVPATIAIIDHEFRLGLDEDALSRLLTRAEKASIRDLTPALVEGGVWATTVASTMAIAAKAGLPLFATGGIGGVHRGASSSFDESADLMALARYPVGVVCAGAKAVLDLPKTMERLETLGVPVVGYQTRELPAFYHAQSNLQLVCRADDEERLARLLYTQLHRVEGSGLLITQPPPADKAQQPQVIDALIEEALALAQAQNVRGRAVTPFLLKTLDEKSSGDVVQTNVALVEHNARLAARTAVALQKLKLDL